MSENQAVTDERPSNGWTPMIFISLGVALIIMDATIVNVILPSIIGDLGINSIDAEWINAVYSLTFAAFLIVMGRLGDRYGRRFIFILGTLVFAGASIMAATSTTASVLITARAIQGIGGAMMSPTSLSIVNSLYKGKSRGIAFAFYGATIGGMAAVGPLLGGWLTQTFSWHWAFWINVPVALFITYGLLKHVPEVKAEGDVGKPDYVGAVFSTLGIAALIFALIEGRNYGWWNVIEDVTFLGRVWSAGTLSPVAYAFVISVIALVGLYRYETSRTKKGESALIDFALFKIPTFGFGSFAGLIVSLGEFGILFSLPLFMQSVLGWSSLGAGALLAILALGAFFAAPTAAKIANARNPRFVARLGLVLEIVAILGISLFVSPTVSGWILGLWLFIYGVGVGYATAQLTSLIMSDIPLEKSGQASGTQSTARQIGSAMGTAVLGTILFVSLHDNTYEQVSSLPTASAGAQTIPAESVANVVEESAGTAIPALADPPGSPEIQGAASQAFADSLSSTGYAAAGFLVLGLLATLKLPEGRSYGRRPDADEAELIHDFE